SGRRWRARPATPIPRSSAASRTPTCGPLRTRRSDAVKIVDARVFVCSPGRNFVTLKITTDEGIYGLGDATLNGRELAVASYLAEHVVPCLIGRDPFQTE